MGAKSTKPGGGREKAPGAHKKKRGFLCLVEGGLRFQKREKGDGGDPGKKGQQTTSPETPVFFPDRVGGDRALENG